MCDSATDGCCSNSFLGKCTADPYQCLKKVPTCSSHKDCATGEFCEKSVFVCSKCTTSYDTNTKTCKAFDDFCCSDAFLAQCVDDPAKCVVAGVCKLHTDCPPSQYCGAKGVCHACAKVETSGFKCDSYDSNCCTQSFAYKCPGDYYGCVNEFKFAKEQINKCLDTFATQTGRYKITSVDENVELRLVWTFSPEYPCSTCVCGFGAENSIDFEQALNVGIRKDSLNKCLPVKYDNAFQREYFVKVAQTQGEQLSVSLYTDRTCQSIISAVCTDNYEPCALPFTYKNKTYNDCTAVDNFGVRWCVTQYHTAQAASGTVIKSTCQESRCQAGPYTFDYEDMGKCISTQIPQGKFTLVRNNIDFPIRWTWSPTLEECELPARKQNTSYFVGFTNLLSCVEVPAANLKTTNIFKVVPQDDGSFNIQNYYNNKPFCERPNLDSVRNFMIEDMGQCIKDSSKGYFRVDEVNLNFPLSFRYAPCGVECHCLARMEVGGYQAVFTSLGECTRAVDLEQVERRVLYFRLGLDASGFYQITRFHDSLCSRFHSTLLRFDGATLSGTNNNCFKVPEGRVVIRQYVG